MLTMQAKQLRSTYLYILLLAQWLFALTFVSIIGGWKDGLQYIYFSPEWNWPQIFAVVTTTIWLLHFPCMFFFRSFFFKSERFRQVCIFGAYYIMTVLVLGLVGNFANILAYIGCGALIAGLMYSAYPFQKKLTLVLTCIALLVVGYYTYISLPDRYCWDKVQKLPEVNQNISSVGNYQMQYIENCVKDFKSGPIARLFY